MNALRHNLTKLLLRQQSLTRNVIKCSCAVNFTSLPNNLFISNSLQYKVNFANVRYKSKKAKYDSDDDENENVFDNDDVSLSKDSKLLKFKTTSLRVDGILKIALGVARNKIEKLFYESKIRINGKKILKKSVSVRIGDEVDVIKLVSPNNPNHLYVARIEIMAMTANEENITITARRFKNLLIENYDQDPYKASETLEEN